MSTELTTDVIDVTPQQPPRNALANLRDAAMSVNVEIQQQALAEYADRRRGFRDWLMSQMISGVHYGYPPGLKPKKNDDGMYIVSNWDKKTSSYKQTLVDPKDWQYKPSLYKPGGELLIDLLGWRADFELDLAGWEMLGKPPMTFMMKCTLYNRTNGKVEGMGFGCRKVGQKGGDENNAVKMAEKSAMLDAVLKATGTSDLFTQDLEEDDPPLTPNANPAKNEEAPKAPTRQQRATKPKKTDEICQRVWRAFFSVRSEEFDGSLELAKKTFTAWVRRVLGREFDIKDDSQWNTEDEQYCIDKLEEFKKR